VDGGCSLDTILGGGSLLMSLAISPRSSMNFDLFKYICTKAKYSTFLIKNGDGYSAYDAIFASVEDMKKAGHIWEEYTKK
jgi:hypothetical protein